MYSLNYHQYIKKAPAKEAELSCPPLRNNGDIDPPILRPVFFAVIADQRLFRASPDNLHIFWLKAVFQEYIDLVFQ